MDVCITHLTVSWIEVVTVHKLIKIYKLVAQTITGDIIILYRLLSEKQNLKIVNFFMP